MRIKHIASTVDKLSHLNSSLLLNWLSPGGALDYDIILENLLLVVVLLHFIDVCDIILPSDVITELQAPFLGLILESTPLTVAKDSLKKSRIKLRSDLVV